MPKAHQKRPGLWEAKGRGPNGRKSFYGSTEKEAVEKARDSLLGARPQTTLYGYFANVFCPSVRHYAHGTRKVYAAAFESYWLPLFGERELASIGRAEIQAVINRMQGKPGTIAQYLSKLSGVFDLAVSDGVVVSNPCKGVRRPRVRYESPEPLSASELWNLYRSTEGAMRNAVVLMGFFGLRVGEACGATMPIDGLLRVDKQWGGEPLKTECSYRTLPVPPECSFEPSDILLVGLSPAYVRRRLPVQPHSLRHTFATILEWDLDCPRRVTNALMGHKGDTGDIYSHRSREALRSWLSRFWVHASTSCTTLSVVHDGSHGPA